VGELKLWSDDESTGVYGSMINVVGDAELGGKKGVVIAGVEELTKYSLSKEKQKFSGIDMGFFKDGNIYQQGIKHTFVGFDAATVLDGFRTNGNIL